MVEKDQAAYERAQAFYLFISLKARWDGISITYQHTKDKGRKHKSRIASIEQGMRGMNLRYVSCRTSCMQQARDSTEDTRRHH